MICYDIADASLTVHIGKARPRMQPRSRRSKRERRRHSPRQQPARPTARPRARTRRSQDALVDRRPRRPKSWTQKCRTTLAVTLDRPTAPPHPLPRPTAATQWWTKSCEEDETTREMRPAKPYIFLFEDRLSPLVAAGDVLEDGTRLFCISIATESERECFHFGRAANASRMPAIKGGRTK